jgi:hypothetical protein
MVQVNASGASSMRRQCVATHCERGASSASKTASGSLDPDASARRPTGVSRTILDKIDKDDARRIEVTEAVRGRE